LATDRGATPDPADGWSPVFAGYMRIGRETYFAVQPFAHGSPIWVRQGERVDEVFITSFNPETDTLGLEVRGKSFELKLPMARVRSELAPIEAVLSRTEALAIARREVERRAGWTIFSLVQARKPDGNYQFFALKRSALKTERRLVVVGPESQVTQYRSLTSIAHAGTLPVLSEPFTTAVKRPAFTLSRRPNL
jgi:hypothetical protein